jgi:hypothetical protein
MSTEEAAPEETVFRPAKRRKFARAQRPSEDEELEAGRGDVGSLDNNRDISRPGVVDILRSRKTKGRRYGIEFSNARARSSEPTSTEIAVVDPDAERMKAISDRFVAHSGQVIDVDKHMFVSPSLEMLYRTK